MSRWRTTLFVQPCRRLSSPPMITRQAIFRPCNILRHRACRSSTVRSQQEFNSRRTFAGSTRLKPENSDNYWQVPEATANEWWLDYESTRPNFEASGFLNLIYDYHSSKPGNEFKVAHDVAAGAGHTAKSLYYHFDTTVVSDENEISLNAARARMTKDKLDEDNVEFIRCSAETLASHVEPASADVITVAEAITMMDQAVVLRQFAHVLKPGGTLAAWFYGRPLFSEPEYIDKCQATWDNIISRVYAKAINGGGPEVTASWQRSGNNILSWLDNVDLSTSGLWQDVERHRINSTLTDHPGFFTEESLGDEAVPLRRSHSAVNFWNEKLVRVDDTAFWEDSWTIDGVRRYVRYACPGVQEAVEQDQEIERLLQELGTAMGGEGAERKYTIACALILARRTDKPVK